MLLLKLQSVTIVTTVAGHKLGAWGWNCVAPDVKKTEWLIQAGLGYYSLRLGQIRIEICGPKRLPLWVRPTFDPDKWTVSRQWHKLTLFALTGRTNEPGTVRGHIEEKPQFEARPSLRNHSLQFEILTRAELGPGTSPLLSGVSDSLRFKSSENSWVTGVWGSCGVRTEDGPGRDWAMLSFGSSSVMSSQD